MHQIKFSIIVPVYKTEQYLSQCINSIINQTYCEFELILVDDGSPDSCPVICNQYAARDSRIRVIHKKNQGLSSARNAGLDVATGEYILFIDSDDYLLDENSLLIVAEKLKVKNADVLIIGLCKYYQKSGSFVDVLNPTLISKCQDMEALMKNNIFVASACDKVIRRSLIEKNSLRFVEGQLSEDIEWCTMLLRDNLIIDCVQKSQYVYRQQNANSISSNISRKNLEDILDVLVRYSQDDDNPYVKHFMANQLVLWLTNSFYIKKSRIKDLLLTAQKLNFLLEYDWYPYTRMVKKIKIKNVMILRGILGCYRTIKQKYR